MRVFVFQKSSLATDYTAEQIIASIRLFRPTVQKPFFVLGLPTGSTPEPVYKRLVEAYQKRIITFRHVVSFNMDEYVGLPDTHPQSYHFFMRKHLFDHVDMPDEQIYIPDGMSHDTSAACLDYERKIKSFGGIDIQLGGIGENGHLAFNEPGTAFDSLTHLQLLTQNTIQVNARFFENLADVPTRALTIGLKTIFNARKVMILATGNKKAQAVCQSVCGPITTDCPASMLQSHKNAFMICDSAAAAALPKK